MFRRSDRLRAPVLSSLMLMAAVSWLLTGCGPTSEAQRRGLPASLRVERTCRRILADLPAGISVQEARKAYGRCLRVMNEEDPRSAASSLPSPGSGPAAVPPPAAIVPQVAATVQERYVYCRMHSEAIRAAADRYNRSLMGFGSTQAEPGSEASARAQQERADALQGLAEAIPERFRMGRNLVPDALKEFQHCRFSS